MVRTYVLTDATSHMCVQYLKVTYAYVRTYIPTNLISLPNDEPNQLLNAMLFECLRHLHMYICS